MNGPTAARKLPRTRIATLFVGLNWFSFALVALTAVSGIFVNTQSLYLPAHISAGLLASLVSLFGLVGAMFYLVTTGVAVREAVVENRLSFELYARTKQLKKDTFPLCSAAIIMLIITTVTGAGEHVGKIPDHLHLGLTVVTLITYARAIRQMKSDFYKNKVIMADVLDCID